MGNAGVDVESHAEILDRQFWASVPDKAKEKMLLLPRGRGRSAATERSSICGRAHGARNDVNTAIGILENYARCVYCYGTGCPAQGRNLD